MAAMGFTPEDYEETVEVWPENWQALQIFSLMATQWDAGMSGATGLKYSVLFEVLDRHGFEGDEWWGMLEDIRHMEAKALSEMRNQ